MNGRMKMRGAWGVAALLLLAPGPSEGQEGPHPVPVSEAEFRSLAWLEGRWVGSGGGFDAFYEAYRFTDAGTLEQIVYEDEGFTAVQSRSTMELGADGIRKVRNGVVESVVTHVSPDSIRFERMSVGRPGFSWIRTSDDEWRAVLELPGGRPPVEYVLRKVREHGFSPAEIAAVLQLLPPAARADTRVLARSDSGLVPVRPGTNDWTCWVERYGERMGGNCHHTVLEGFLRRKRELNDHPVEGETSEETLAREYRSGMIALPAGAMEKTGYGPTAEGGGPPTILSGRYFLYQPFHVPADVGVPGEEPSPGAPWLHQAGTITAHIMWSHTTPVAREDPVR